MSNQESTTPSDIGPAVEPETSSASEPTGFPTKPWAISVLAAAVIGWGAVNFLPVLPRAPEKYEGVDMYSPQDLQDEAEEYFLKAKGDKRMRLMTILGGCLGLAPLIFFAQTRRQGWMVGGVVALVAGIGLGAACGVAGYQLRQALGPEAEIPFVNDDNRLVVVDAIVYVATSALLVLAIGIGFVLSAEEQKIQRSLAILLAGALGGGLVPILSVVLPKAQTNLFPPEGLMLTAVWLLTIALLVALLPTATGSKEK